MAISNPLSSINFSEDEVAELGVPSSIMKDAPCGNQDDFVTPAWLNTPEGQRAVAQIKENLSEWRALGDRVFAAEVQYLLRPPASDYGCPATQLMLF